VTVYNMTRCLDVDIFSCELVKLIDGYIAGALCTLLNYEEGLRYEKKVNLSLIVLFNICVPWGKYFDCLSIS